MIKTAYSAFPTLELVGLTLYSDLGSRVEARRSQLELELAQRLELAMHTLGETCVHCEARLEIPWQGDDARR